MATRGRKPVELNLPQLLEDSKKFGTGVLAGKYRVSEPTVRKYLRQAQEGNSTPTPAMQSLINEDKEPKGRVIIPQPSYSPPDNRVLGQTDPAKAADKLAGDSLFDEFYWQYRDALGWKKDIRTPSLSEPCSKELTIIAGDLHAPFQHDRAIQHMVDRTAHKAKRLIIAGDLADMFNMSKYAKFKRHFTPIEEIVRVQALLASFSEAYEEVVLMRGNHDDRFIKYMQRMGLPAEMFEVFDYLHGAYSLHPIYVLARGLKNVQIVEPIKLDYAEFAYLHQQGDCVVSHAELYSQIPNKTACGVIQSLKSFHEPQGVIQPFKVLVQAHTHQAGKVWADYGTVGIENGCLCVTPDYSGDAKRLPRRASVLGFTELYQVGGVSDLEKTNFVPYLGK